MKTNWPADKVERRKVADLIPYARNSRQHSPDQVAQIAASIREWGWTVPVLIDTEGGIIAGHGRIMAAQKLGLEDVPCMVADGWTEAQKRAYVIADNRLAETSSWDMDMLATELEELRLEDFSLDLIGFDSAAIDEMFEGLGGSEGTEGLTDEDEVPEPPADPVSKLGDIWLLGKHRLMCGDSTDANAVAKVLNGVKPHLMVTDPPYGVEYDPSWRAKAGVNKNKGKMGKVLNDDRADWREAWALFPGDVAYVWHASLFTREVLDSLEACGFRHRSMIIWVKDRFTLGRSDYHWQHEPAWYVVKDGKTGHYAGGRRQSTVWSIPARDDSGVGHGTQKPVQCMQRPIENNSSPGQAVYEPFSGSGTTIIAAEQTGRHCYAIELSPAYVDVAVKRWQQFTGQQAIHADTGEPFPSA
jgi:DNA modification methylase